MGYNWSVVFKVTQDHSTHALVRLAVRVLNAALVATLMLGHLEAQIIRSPEISPSGKLVFEHRNFASPGLGRGFDKPLDAW